MRRKWQWTRLQMDKLNKIKGILTELDAYKPLTLRQIYYQMVGKDYIENKVSEYSMLSNLLKWARIDGHISWEDIEDRVRSYHDLTGWGGSDEFIDASLKHFLNGYKRNLLQTQDKYIEIWIEKDALSSIFTKVAAPYTIPVVVCRGFSSVSFLNEFAERLKYNKEKQAIMLYFGDFDPSGIEMLDAMKTTLINELGVDHIKFKRIALSKDDIFTYKLPHNPSAFKHSDSRAAKHLEQHGELAVELDALRPDVLEQKIMAAIEGELDMRLFRKQQYKEKSEMRELIELKTKVVDFIKS